MPLIDVGDAAPDFTLPDQGGVPRSLRSLLSGPLVLYFYPEDDTPSCTTQACQFRDTAPELSSLGASVVGVSPDEPKSHAKFERKHLLGFTLLADPPVNGIPPLCNEYGVWSEKSMYGRTYMGVVRTTYLIGADGKVARRWDSVRVPGHAEEVLEALRELVGTQPASKPPSPKPKLAKAGLERSNPSSKSKGSLTRPGPTDRGPEKPAKFDARSRKPEPTRRTPRR